MEGEKQIQEVERQPRQVEEARSHAAEKRTDVVKIAQRLQAFVASADRQRQPHDGVEHPRVERFVQRRSDPAENADADQVEKTRLWSR